MVTERSIRSFEDSILRFATRFFQAASANKRLKEALQKKKSAADERNKQLERSEAAGKRNRDYIT